jgi:hypothetical protein
MDRRHRWVVRAVAVVAAVAVASTAGPVVSASGEPERGPVSASWLDLVSPEHNPPGTPDTDGDGLPDPAELVLGTDPTQADTDGDGLEDRQELELGLDPLLADTNGDGLPDGIELAIDDDDIDGDGTPNALDGDNDGDGVRDGLDLSANAATESQESFRVDLRSNGGPGLVDLQIVPEDTDLLGLAGAMFDWPDDDAGQMQDLDGSTEDVHIAPMLELTMQTARPMQDDVAPYGMVVPEGEEPGALLVRGIALEERDGRRNLYLFGGEPAIDPRAPDVPTFHGGYQIGWDLQVGGGPLGRGPARWTPFTPEQPAPANVPASLGGGAVARLSRLPSVPDLVYSYAGGGPQSLGAAFCDDVDPDRPSQPGWPSEICDYGGQAYVQHAFVPGLAPAFLTGGAVGVSDLDHDGDEDIIAVGVKDVTAPGGVEETRVVYRVRGVTDPGVGWGWTPEIEAPADFFPGVPMLPDATHPNRGQLVTAVEDLDGNGMPDLLIGTFPVFDWGGPVQLRYRIGWDLDVDGQVSGGWSGLKATRPLDPAASGWGASVIDLDGNGSFELVIMGVDDAERHRFHYRVGWDLSVPPEWWTPGDDRWTREEPSSWSAQERMGDRAGPTRSTCPSRPSSTGAGSWH